MGPAIREHPGTRAVPARAPPPRSPRAAGRPRRPGRPTRSRRRRSVSRRAGSRGPSRRPLPPLSNLSGVLPVVSGTGAVERVAGGAARREVRLRERRGGADEIPMAEIQLRQDVGGLHARLALDEARVPRIEVIIRPGRVGRFAPGDVAERRDHRLVPAADVNQDLAHAPAPEPDHGARLPPSMRYRCGPPSLAGGSSGAPGRSLRTIARVFGTRLAAKPFVISLLVIVVLTVVGYLSFHAVGNLVAVNREIATRTIPAIRLAPSTREPITTLVRPEMRALVLGYPGYAKAWNERAARVAEDLEQLASYAQSARETIQLAAARSAFERYRGVVIAEQDLLRRGEKARALALTDAEARTLAEEVQESLDGLMAAIHTRVLAAQAEAARLEARTWTGVLIALGAAVGLALLVALENARLHAEAQLHIRH